MRQNIDAFLSRITAPSPLTLLDFGCGPGRDLKTFHGLGHIAIGLDGAASLRGAVEADGEVPKPVEGFQVAPRAAAEIEQREGWAP